MIGENGATEIFTDEKGYACSIAIPYGTYIVRETTTPHNYTPVDDFIVQITENHPSTPQVWRVMLDKEFEAKLKIIKQDDETKKAVLQKNTEFKIFNMDTEKYGLPLEKVLKNMITVKFIRPPVRKYQMENLYEKKFIMVRKKKGGQKSVKKKKR